MNWHTGADLKKLTEDELITHFGKAGKFYYGIVRGVDDRPVTPDRETKSVGAEDTFAYDLMTAGEMNIEIDKIAETVCRRLQQNGLKGRTVTLKIKYGDFRQITRSLSFLLPVNDYHTISETARRLLLSTEPAGKKTRLLGISVSNFSGLTVPPKKGNVNQLRLF